MDIDEEGFWPLGRATASAQGRVVHHIKVWGEPNSSWNGKEGEHRAKWWCGGGTSHGVKTDKPANCEKCIHRMGP